MNDPLGSCLRGLYRDSDPLLEDRIDGLNNTLRGHLWDSLWVAVGYSLVDSLRGSLADG